MPVATWSESACSAPVSKWAHCLQPDIAAIWYTTLSARTRIRRSTSRPNSFGHACSHAQLVGAAQSPLAAMSITSLSAARHAERRAASRAEEASGPPPNLTRSETWSRVADSRFSRIMRAAAFSAALGVTPSSRPSSSICKVASGGLGGKGGGVRRFEDVECDQEHGNRRQNRHEIQGECFRAVFARQNNSDPGRNRPATSFSTPLCLP